jgi:hypothetical protein
VIQAKPPIDDPTYDRERIDRDPVWKLAFWMSEIDNDAAPIGWFRYVHLARALIDTFEPTKKPTTPSLHYFDRDKAPPSDVLLGIAKAQGYVPTTCLLAGVMVMHETNAGRDACAGCNGPREKCHGRPKHG